MAQTGFDQSQTGSPEASPKVAAERARQRRNSQGMAWVLSISLALVVAAYIVMLALQQRPVTPDNKPAELTAATSGPGAPPPVTQETAQSPPR